MILLKKPGPGSELTELWSTLGLLEKDTERYYEDDDLEEIFTASLDGQDKVIQKIAKKFEYASPVVETGDKRKDDEAKKTAQDVQTKVLQELSSLNRLVPYVHFTFEELPPADSIGRFSESAQKGLQFMRERLEEVKSKYPLHGYLEKKWEWENEDRVFLAVVGGNKTGRLSEINTVFFNALCRLYHLFVCSFRFDSSF